MVDQTDNLTLNDDSTGLIRTVDPSNDDVVLSVSLTLQSGGVFESDNIKRGSGDPTGAVTGNEGDLFLRTDSANGDVYVNTDGTINGWERKGAFVGGRLYDAVVDAGGGGDFTLISAAITSGAQSIFVRTGTYAESTNLVLTDAVRITGEEAGGAVVSFTGAVGFQIDGSGGVIETAGTVSITNGTSAVTGAGTTFTNLSPGDYIALGTRFYEIAAIADATNLTITDTYQGEDLSGFGLVGQSMTNAVCIENLVITGSSGTGLFIRAGRNVAVFNTAVVGCLDNCQIQESGGIQLRNVSSTNATNDGVEVTNSGVVQAISCLLANNGGSGFEFLGASQVCVLDSCHITANAVHGVQVTDTATAIAITDSIITYNNLNGINTDPSTARCQVQSCTISFNGQDGIDFDGANNVVVGNNITNNADDGIQSGDQGVVSGNTISDNGSNGINADFDNNSTFSANTIHDNTGDGIFCASTNDCVFIGNVIFDNGGDGIEIPATGSDNNVITDNRIFGNTGAQVNNLAPTTVFGISAAGNAAQGEVLFYNGTVWERLAVGTSGQVLQTQGAGSDPQWANAAPFSDIAEASGTITTTSTTDVIATGMTLTPPAGTYLVWFSSSVSNTTASAIMNMSIHIDGVQQVDSERQVERGAFFGGDTDHGFASMAKVTVNGAQQIEGRWRTNTGTAQMFAGRTLMIAEVT